MPLFSIRSTSFSGGNQFVEIGDIPPFQFERTDIFSFSCWFRDDGGAVNRILLSKMRSAAPFEGYALQMRGADTGKLRVYLINDFGGGNFIQVETTTVLANEGRWRHVVVTYDGSSSAAGVTIYVDGQVETPSNVVDSLSASILTTIPLQIGARFGSGNWLGNIDDVAIYDIELTSGQASTLYNNGSPPNLASTGPPNLIGYWMMGDGDTFPTIFDKSPTHPTFADQSANSNDATSTNTTATNVVGDAPFGTLGRGSISRFALWSVQLNPASTQYVDVADVAAFQFERTSTFSLSCWFKTNATTEQVLAGKRDATGVRQGYSLLMNASGQLVMNLVNTDASNEIIKRTDSTFNDGSWHHVAMTYAGGSSAADVLIYVDGALEAMTTVADTLSATILHAVSFQLGGSDGADTFDGNLTQCAVYSDVLTSSEVNTIYNFGHPNDLANLGSSGNLVGWWGMGNNVNDGAMTNMVSGDIEEDTSILLAPGIESGTTELFSELFLGELIQGSTWTSTGGASAGPVITYVMRGRDDGRSPGSDYIHWIVTGTPDFAGAGFAGGTPTPIGNLIPGSVTIAAQK